jgi:hypothetical protein
VSGRVWTTVVVTAATLVIASNAKSAWPTVVVLIEQVERPPWTVVGLATVSCLLWLAALLRIYRTWAVRRNLVRVLARFGISTAAIADAARLSQDGVSLLTARRGGSSVSSHQEIFSGTGNQFTSATALQTTGK